MGKILRGDVGSDEAWVESKGIVLDRRDGERRGKEEFFSFFGDCWVWERWNDDFSIGIVFDLGKRKEEDKIKFAKALKSFRENIFILAEHFFAGCRFYFWLRASETIE